MKTLSVLAMAMIAAKSAAQEGALNTSIADPHCSNALVTAVEKLFGASSIHGIADTLLGTVQKSCASGHCPHVDVSSTCKEQSIDDIHCGINNIFSTNLKLGTDSICDAGCDDWPCKVACNGIDTGICYSSDWILCKAGCLGISSCVHKCEHAIVDPCKQKLIKDCSNKCEATFNSCKAKCKDKLTLRISGDFERLQRIITSMNVSTLDVSCSGNGILSPFNFNANASVSLNSAALDLKIHLDDVGISTTNDVALQKIAVTVAVPMDGSVQCGPLASNITMNVGKAQVTNFNLDVDLQLDKTLRTIAAVVCADLPFCKDAIKNAIAKEIKDQIFKAVPPQVAKQLQPVLQKLVSQAHCPKIEKTTDTEVVV